MASGLATRCPACGTVFRVVLDQLRVSEGWVRCGRCTDVFNAAEALVDLETGAPQRMHFEPAPAPNPAPALADFGRRAPSPPPSPPPPVARATPRHSESYDDEAPPPPPRHAVPVIDTPESRFSDDAADALDAMQALHAGERSLAPPPTEDQPDAGVVVTPSFVRRAERAQRWRQPRVRAALIGTGVIATLALLTQVAFEYRDLMAARFTATRPLLEQACAWAGCSVGAARSIEGFSVESSGLVRVERSNLYRLSVALRNRAAIELALPAVELALTDSQGKLLSRRVLRPSELGSAQNTIAAGRDLLLQATVQTTLAANEPVSGYTIELFYP